MSYYALMAFALLGWIDAGRTWPGIDRNAWLRLIDDLESLAATPPDRHTSPLTGEMIEFPANPTSALVAIEERTIGEIVWSSTGPNELLVRGDATLVPPIAQQIAERLGASYQPIPAAKR